MRKIFIPTKENNFKPHILREVTIIALVVISIFLFIFSSISPVLINRIDFLGAIYSSVLVDLANESRVQNRRAPLVVNPLLEEAARLKAEDMAEKGYFSHVSPDGKSPWYWISGAGYKFIYAGENLAVDFEYSEDVNEAWLNSPGHRDNILNNQFTEIGIATAEGRYNGRKTTFVVQMFGTPVPQVQPEPQAQVAGSRVVAPVEPVAVKEESIVVVEEVVEPEEIFVAVENTEELEAIEAPQASEVLEDEAPGYEARSNWLERLLVNPAQVIQYVFYGLALLVIAALLLMIFVNIQVQHPKNITYGVVLLAILSGLMYLNESEAVRKAVVAMLE